MQGFNVQGCIQYTIDIANGAKPALKTQAAQTFCKHRTAHGVDNQLNPFSIGGGHDLIVKIR